jgi:hypothetical protein
MPSIIQLSNLVFIIHDLLNILLCHSIEYIV